MGHPGTPSSPGWSPSIPTGPASRCDHVDAVVAAIDVAQDGVVLVGHSGGGAIAHAAVDARPERVLRVVYVDSWPVGTGGCIDDELPSERRRGSAPDTGRSSLDPTTSPR
jgi:pimeloyl-ACP methyl ester carboxylesterase